MQNYGKHDNQVWNNYNDLGDKNIETNGSQVEVSSTIHDKPNALHDFAVYHITHDLGKGSYVEYVLRQVL